MGPNPLFTIGYQGSSIGDFRAALEAARIDVVVDVRDVPVSRKPGFSKAALAVQLASVDIDYLHLKGLGDPKAGRIAARKGRIGDFRRIFAAHLDTREAQADLAAAIQAADHRRACLLCFERDHHLCHRCIVAARMAHKAGFKLIHLSVHSGIASHVDHGFECTHAGASTLVG